MSSSAYGVDMKRIDDRLRPFFMNELPGERNAQTQIFDSGASNYGCCHSDIYVKNTTNVKNVNNMPNGRETRESIHFRNIV